METTIRLDGSMLGTERENLTDLGRALSGWNGWIRNADLDGVPATIIILPWINEDVVRNRALSMASNPAEKLGAPRIDGGDLGNVGRSFGEIIVRRDGKHPARTLITGERVQVSYNDEGRLVLRIIQGDGADTLIVLGQDATGRVIRFCSKLADGTAAKEQCVLCGPGTWIDPTS